MTLVVHTRLHKRRQHNVFCNFQKTVPTFAEMQQTYHPCYDLHNCQNVTLLKVAQFDYGRKKRRIQLFLIGQVTTTNEGIHADNDTHQ